MIGQESLLSFHGFYKHLTKTPQGYFFGITESGWFRDNTKFMHGGDLLYEPPAGLGMHQWWQSSQFKTARDLSHGIRIAVHYSERTVGSWIASIFGTVFIVEFKIDKAQL